MLHLTSRGDYFGLRFMGLKTRPGKTSLSLDDSLQCSPGIIHEGVADPRDDFTSPNPAISQVYRSIHPLNQQRHSRKIVKMAENFIARTSAKLSFE